MSLIKYRAAFIQGTFNERMGKILAYEITALTFIGAIIFAFLWGWEWFFWGLVLIPVSLSIGLFVPILADIILLGLGMCWATPFIFLGSMGYSAGYLMAVVAFILSFWVHFKGMSFYIDLDRGKNW